MAQPDPSKRERRYDPVCECCRTRPKMDGCGCCDECWYSGRYTRWRDNREHMRERAYEEAADRRAYLYGRMKEMGW